MAIPHGPNQYFNLHFLSGILSSSRRFRKLNVTDDFSHKFLAVVVDTSLPGIPVGRELDRVVEIRGYLCMVAAKSRMERIRNAILKFQEYRKVGCVMNVLTSGTSNICAKPALSWRHGATTSIIVDRTQASLA